MQSALRAGLVAGLLLIAAGLILAVSRGQLHSGEVRLSDLLPLIVASRAVVRVLLLIAGFSLARDWKFALVAAGVAGLLGIGLALGRI